MTREEAARLFPLLKAFSEGEDIQVRDGELWVTLDSPRFNTGDGWEYRIKPKPREVYLALHESGAVAAIFSSPHSPGAIKFREVLD